MFWSILEFPRLILLGCAVVSMALAGTAIEPKQLPWTQVNRAVCGGVKPSGTSLALNQVRKPIATLDACWPEYLSRAAWDVIWTRCTICHGETGPPPDTALTFDAIKGEVGNLDMRNRERLLIGGKRGPALKPGDPMGSLIYLFTSRIQLGRGMGTPRPENFLLIDMAQGAGFRYVPTDSDEDSTAKPPSGMIPDIELEALRVWISSGAP